MPAFVPYVPSRGPRSSGDGLIRRYDRGHVRRRGVREFSALAARTAFSITVIQERPLDRVFRGVLVPAEQVLSLSGKDF